MSDELDERSCDGLKKQFEAADKTEESMCDTLLTNQLSYKKKQRGLKRKTCTYVDLDQEVDQEDVVQMAAALSWSNSTRILPPDRNSSGRETVTYEDIAPQLVSVRKHQLKNSTPAHPPIRKNSSGRKSVTYEDNAPQMASIRKHQLNTSTSQLASQKVDYNQPLSLSVNESMIHQNLLNYVDPSVTASEKQPIFKKPILESEMQEASKKVRRRKKKTQYWEQRRQREALEQERKKNQPVKPTVVCHFYINGNCRKGDECTFSHTGEQRKKTELCRFYVKGSCMKGSDCPFHHSTWPCKFFHKFDSCSSDPCKFSHEPLTDETRLLLEKSIFDIPGRSGEGSSQQNGDSSGASGNCCEKFPESSLDQRPPCPKPYKLDAIEFEPASNDKISPAIDSEIVSATLRFADDPRTTRGQSSSTTLEPHSSFEITPFTRLIPFADKDDYCSTQARSSVANGSPVNEEPNKLVEDQGGSTTPSVADGSHVVAAIPIVGARHIMHHNVDWMSSARSIVRQKPTSTPSYSCPP